MKKITLSAIVAVGLSCMTMAGGDIAPVSPAPADSWSGFYVGLQAGGIWGDADVDYDDEGTARHTHGLNVDGFAGGLYGGYNWLLENNWLVGVEGEWNYIDADDSGAIDNAPTFSTKVEQKWDASLRARVGKVMGDYLPYLTGGVAWGNFDLKAYANDGSASYSKSMALTGWTIGVGLEMKLSENIHARIQYRYTDYGDKTKNISSGFDGKLNYNAHMVMVGISYRF